LIGVHVRTFRNVARDGRLSVTYDTRTTFRCLRARATLADARTFRRSYYGHRVRAEDRRVPLTWSTVPLDYDVKIRVLRQRLGMSQARFADLVGAARKAVVYQWESRKRTPSPVFWQRIQALSQDV
jgi:DNA-binding XRE family transcriptional regulator